MNAVAGQSPNTQEKPRGASLEVEKIGELLKELCITRSNLNLYSFEHDVARKSLKHTYEALNRLLTGRDQIAIDITRSALLFEGLPVEERNPMVERIARDLRGLRVNGFTFKKGITLKELAIFFKMLTLKKEEVERMQGARALLEELGVEHIGINQVRYVRLEDDKKIVAKDAHVLQRTLPAPQVSERELLNGLVKALMDKQADRDWLLEEIRIDPARVANQMVAMIKYFDDQDVLKQQESRQEALDALLTSIKTLGVRLSERDAGEGAGEEDRTLAQSMLILEQELKTRSAGLKSSKAVTRFVEEITSMVTAFIDNHQANLVVKEYLKDEKGLKRTEHLLRTIMKREPESSLMPRLQTVLKEKGLTEKDLEKLIVRLFPDPKITPDGKPRKKKPRRHRAPRPVMEKIENALTAKLDSAQDKEEVTSYLAGVFQREVNSRLQESQEERVRLAADLKRVDEMLSSAGLGLIVLDEEGRVIMATGPSPDLPGEGPEPRLEPGLREFIVGISKGASYQDRAAFLNSRPPEERDRLNRFLEGIDHPIVSEEGELLGMIMKTS